MNPSLSYDSTIPKIPSLLTKNQAVKEASNTQTEINNQPTAMKDDSASTSIIRTILRYAGKLIRVDKLLLNLLFSQESASPSDHSIFDGTSSLPKSEKTKCLWLHNDSKVVTENCLLKLQQDLQDYAEIDLAFVDSISQSGADHYDTIFLFYYVAGGREISEVIEAKVADVASIYPKNTINVIVLKDADAKISIDTTKVFHKSFQIFTDPLGYSQLVLYTEKIRNYDKRFLEKLHENYESLLECIKTAL